MAKTVSSGLEKALHSCVKEICDAVESGSLDGATFSSWKEWRCGADGQFRPHYSSRLAFLSTDFESLPSFEKCVELAKKDEVIGPQLDAFVGGIFGARVRLDMQQIMRSLLGPMISDEGRIKYSEDRFQEQWREINRFLSQDDIPYVTLAPLPNLVADFPVRITDKISIDRFSEKEVSRCILVQLLRPIFSTFEVVPKDSAVGIRSLSKSSKVVGDLQIQADSAKANNNLFDQNKVVLDVVLALRLLKPGKVVCSGILSYNMGQFIDFGITSYRQAQPPHPFSNFKLEQNEEERLKELWNLLTSANMDNRRFLEMALRRFNMACDRHSVEDQLVDLSIAAESLFLHDVGGGELQFRLAIRAADFCGGSEYERRDVYALVRSAYKLRSRIVHGTELKNGEADKTSEVVTKFEDLLRFSIKKALRDDHIGENGYWDDLHFKPKR